MNDRLFPDKDHLHIYLWNNEFTNYYNNGRYWNGAYVWSVYDEKKSDLLFLMLYWYWIEERGAALGGSPFFINPILLLS
ncbi:hypothetical protein FH958_000118 [Enterococcus faecium]|nr:hypothetical protein [Enterococcus faecium]